MLYGKPPAPTIYLLLALAGVCLGSARAPAQDPLEPRPMDVLLQPLVGRDLADALGGPPPVSEEAAPPGHAARFCPFHMMPGFLTDLPGLITDDDPVTIGDPAASQLGNKDTDGPNWIQVTLGNDNPYFDFRWPGDPGGVGFYKVHSQVQLLDSGCTSLCLNCQAVTPAGLESGGVADGPTVITPGFGVFQELGWGTALQGYAGTNLRQASHFADRLEGGYQYGVSWQCPLPGLTSPDDKTGVYVFMQALGRYRYEGDTQAGRPAVWEFVPGIHWQVADSCWMSLGGTRTSLLTCSWRY